MTRRWLVSVTIVSQSLGSQSGRLRNPSTHNARGRGSVTRLSLPVLAALAWAVPVPSRAWDNGQEPPAAQAAPAPLAAGQVVEKTLRGGDTDGYGVALGAG